MSNSLAIAISSSLVALLPDSTQGCECCSPVGGSQHHWSLGGLALEHGPGLHAGLLPSTWHHRSGCVSEVYIAGPGPGPQRRCLQGSIAAMMVLLCPEFTAWPAALAGHDPTAKN